MKEIELVKKYSGWEDVECKSIVGYEFYFESPFGELKKLNDCICFYTSSKDMYLVVVAKKSYYIAFLHDKTTVYCFAELDSLQEACEAL